jgi:aminopeptidase N
MENKGLNLFNAQYVLASRETATDSDYENIEAVVAHEYFHNWTGNRITCRDWFQLSLKEGLTVFREQQFCADMHSVAVKRIQDVQRLRTTQFSEDAGPLAHPVRPASYIEINNFYTPTVYEKGAEVIRMLHVLLGPAGFRRGMDLYFARHDGQAVTIDDFVAALADANGVDLQEFKHWYDQAGTPHIEVRREHDPATRRLRLILRQHTAPTPGQPDKRPLLIPIRMGLLNAAGEPLPLRLADADDAPLERVLQLDKAEQVFEFQDIEAPAIVSLLRGFSAPVHLHHDLSREERLLLVAHDQDAFNRWDAAQQLMAEMILQAAHENGTIESDPALIEALSAILADAHDDPAWAAEVLEVPPYDYLAGLMEPVIPDALEQAREGFRHMLGQALESEFKRCYEALKDVDDAGARRLKNRCLSYLCATEETPLHYADCCRLQYLRADNMTDALAALSCLSRWRWTQTDAALTDFYQRWQTEELVVNKWFSLQATAPRDDVLTQVRTLLGHPAFDIRNPNRARALIGAFCRSNPRYFHAADGSGYGFLFEQIEILAALNPQVAARLTGSLTGYRRYAQPWHDAMRATLQKIIGIKQLPKDVYEVVEKSIQD